LGWRIGALGFLRCLRNTGTPIEPTRRTEATG
jgi:hypothetical protein